MHRARYEAGVPRTREHQVPAYIPDGALVPTSYYCLYLCYLTSYHPSPASGTAQLFLTAYRYSASLLPDHGARCQLANLRADAAQ